MPGNRTRSLTAKARRYKLCLQSRLDALLKFKERKTATELQLKEIPALKYALACIELVHSYGYAGLSNYGLVLKGQKDFPDDLGHPIEESDDETD